MFFSNSSWKNDDISQKVKFSRQDHGASLPAKSSFINEYEKYEKAKLGNLSIYLLFLSNGIIIIQNLISIF